MAAFEKERARLKDIQAAIGANDTKALKALHDEAAPVIAYKDGEGASPVHWAARAGSVEALKYLLSLAPETATERDAKGRSPLMAACAERKGAPCVSVLLGLSEVKATVNLPAEGPCAIHLAVCHSFDVTKLLIQSGANPNAPSASGFPLHWCLAHNGPEDVALLLIDSGADVNAVDENGATPIILACLLGNVSVTRKLIEKGAKVDQFARNLSALAAAAVSNSIPCAEALLKVDPNLAHLRDPMEHLRPLEVAAHACNKEMVEFLAPKTDSAINAEELMTRITREKTLEDEKDLAAKEASEAASRKAREDGNVLFRQGKFREAGVVYTKGLSGAGARASERSRAVLLTNMSLCTFRMDDWASSRQMAQQALDLDKTYIKAQVRLGAACEKLGDYEAAAGAYWAAYNLDKASKDAPGLLKLFNDSIRLAKAMHQEEKAETRIDSHRS